MATNSDSDGSEFEGFLEEDIVRIERNIDTDELDIDFSSDDSESDDGENIEETGEGNDIDIGEEDEQDGVRDEETWTPPLTDKDFARHQGNAGANHNLPRNATAVDYLFLFFTADLFKSISEQTNLYAEQRISKLPGGIDKLWKPTTPEEMKAYFAINIMMGIKDLPQIWCYWSEDTRFNDPWISSVMAKTRFLKITQYIHLSDTSNVPAHGSPGYDTLYKVRPLIDLMSEKCAECYNPGQELSVDEAMIPFKGRLHFRQYMPQKPVKFGIKVWELCDSETGYCSSFEVYTGKQTAPTPTRVQYGLGYDIVWRLSQRYHNQNRHIYIDQFFNSVPLVFNLAQVNTLVCGTINKNRRGLPPDVKTARLRRRGDLLQVQKGTVMATVFRDKKTLLLLSSNQNPGTVMVGNPPVPRPIVINNYNTFMGGVDKSDQYRSYYSVRRAGKKWWRYIMWFFRNLAVVNSYIVFKKSAHDPPVPNGYDQLTFRADVAKGLRNGFTSRKQRHGRKGRSINTLDVSVHSMGHHKLVRIKGRKRICRFCSSSGVKTPAGRSVETSYRCEFCDIPLCRVKGCFGRFHDEVQF